MLNIRWHRKALRVVIDDRELKFATPGDFAFCVGSRTCVPAKRFETSLRHASDDLWREAEEIKRLEKELIGILEHSRQRGEPCCTAIRQLNLKLFSNDHHWRAIFAVLSGLGSDYDEYQRIGLTKYLQYLGARQEVLRSIYVIKNRGREAEQGPPEDMDRGIGTKETVIFDVMEIEDAQRPASPFQRLPRGEATRLCLGRGPTIEMLLAKYQFSLTRGDDWVLTDAHGKRFQLHQGPNMVGRGLTNDIALDSDFRNVSRQHLIIEAASETDILVTDLSSHGTYVRPTYLDPR